MLCQVLLILHAAVYAAAVGEAQYDYIIIGGGTCGLVLANRLSADQHNSVAVIEAGDSVYDNANVTQIDNYFANLGTSIDWQYPIQPQQYTANRSLTYDQGKALGGTSTINGATFMRAQKAQIDAWAEMGNSGWDWDALWPYYLKSEGFQPPTAELVKRGAAFDPSYHSTGGPVSVGWGNNTLGGGVHSIVNQTWQNLGIPYTTDQSGGDLHGFSVAPNTIDSRKSIRADAARSYYWPIASQRKNLHVFTNTLASKITWQESLNKSSEAVARGVAIQDITSGKSRTLLARKEVIVSAGSLKSPTILEQSGVGNPAILSKHNIPTTVELRSVGENLQDQPNIIVVANTANNTGWQGYPPYITNVLASELFGTNTTNIKTYISSQLPSYASRIAAQSNNAITAKTAQKQLQLQFDLLFTHRVPIAEMLLIPGSTSITAAYWGLLPFSRGNVHLSNTDPTSTPLINPNFFMFDWDEMVAAAVGNLFRKVVHTAPLGNYVGANSLPDDKTVRPGAGLEEWGTFLKGAYTPNSHPIGTCAMMSRDMGGVVDPEMRVYGTKNVRVVDASVLPFQIDGHLTATLYAVSERAADIILRNCR